MVSITDASRFSIFDKRMIEKKMNITGTLLNMQHFIILMKQKPRTK